ncbi:hypothetical protein OCOL_000619 [Ordospora colligata]
MMECSEYFKTMHPVYTNISAQFTGIGHVLIDGEALMNNVRMKYGLNDANVPLHTYLHGTRFMLHNLKKAGFSGIMLFFRREDGYRRVIKEYLQRRFGGIDISEVKEYVENERVALVLGGVEGNEIEFLYGCLGISLYCAVMDQMEFRIPNVHAFVYSPLPRRVEMSSNVYGVGNNENESDSEEYMDVSEEMQRIGANMTLEEMDRKFKMRTEPFGKSEYEVPENICRKLARMYSKGGEEGENDFDGRMLFEDVFMSVNENEERYDMIVGEGHKQIKSKHKGIELELLTNGKEMPTGSAMSHMRNVRKSAQSLFDGKVLYAPIVRSKESKAPKISNKQKMIMEENSKRMQAEKEAKENAWLKSFFGKYKGLDVDGKRSLLESVKADGSGMYRKVLLLKIEFYTDLWGFESKSDDYDERMVVPCYLSCLEYIQDFGRIGSKEQAPKKELEFVLQKLIDCGFEATAREIVEKNGLKGLELDYVTEEGSGPNEFDICFQLKYTGDRLQRSLNSKFDARVLFKPDEWQVKLLDLVDENKSAVISAPTSAGKTFICFYAIEKVLRESDTDVVIFCLPTKALVNQVSADIYARFTPKVNSKMFLQGNLMKDFCVAPWDCQVLIVIPSLLESILNSPPKGFIERVRYIIIDEVHKIGSEEMGIPIERIVHLSPCPMLVLSATLGNIDGFYGWMKKIENGKGRECELVSYGERYCELKPYVYVGTNSQKIVAINNLFAYSYTHIKRFGFGNDISFLPEELLYLYDSICAVVGEEHLDQISGLMPKSFFKSNIITKKDVSEYGRHLLMKFQEMIENDVLSEKQVSNVYKMQTREALKAFKVVNDYSNEYLLDNMLDMLLELKERKMFPCIVFNTDRDFVSKLALRVYERLESMDMEKKKNKLLEKMMKEAKRTRDVEKSRNSWEEESAAAEQSFQMRDDKKNIKYSFIDPLTKLTDYELDEETRFIKNTSFEFIDMLYRGIGVHHAHMNKRYRSLVEILFRQKHLQVLFATETLALGINMPCRSVVFAGDSLQLDPMNYKQMAGRAGRRGFDTLGNVVFMGVPQHRVQNLMVSLLPNIKGVYTYSNTSFVGFDLKESLIKNPLLQSTLYSSSSLEHVERGMDEMKIVDTAKGGKGVGLTNGGADVQTNEENVYDMSDVYGSEKHRRELVEHQLKLIEPYFGDKSYLCDLVIGNRECDPSILAFALLLECNVISFEPMCFMTTLAHFFETRPLLFDMECTLPGLDPAIGQLCRKINTISKRSISEFYPPILRSLQQMSHSPLHTIYSFLVVDNIDKIKNSYLVDFFKHGSWERIANENRVGSGELFKSLSVVNNVILTLIRLYGDYDLCEENKSKIVKFYSLFDPKFKSIYA